MTRTAAIPSETDQVREGKIMRIHRSRPRVIDQDGRSVDDTVEWVHTLRPADARMSAVRTLPVRGDRTLVLRVPGGRRPVSAAEHVAAGFASLGAELNELVAVLSSGARRLAVENDRHDALLEARMCRLESRVHAWSAAGDGYDLAAAYAEGGTERLLALTPQVLAAMDARAKAGLAVAL